MDFTSPCLGNIIFDLVINKQAADPKGGVNFHLDQLESESGHGKQLSPFTLLHFCNTNKITKTYPQMHHLKAAQIIIGREPLPVKRKFLDVLPGHEQSSSVPLMGGSWCS